MSLNNGSPSVFDVVGAGFTRDIWVWAQRVNKPAPTDAITKQPDTI